MILQTDLMHAKRWIHHGALLTMFVAGLLFVTLPATADVGSLVRAKGGGVLAKGLPHQTIRLDAQEVTMRLKVTSYSVDAKFHLFNTGEATTEWIGFPQWLMVYGISVPSIFTRFNCWIDARKVKFSEEPDQSKTKGRDTRPLLKRYFRYPARILGDRISEECRWRVRQVTFPGHSGTTIRVAYDALYTGANDDEAAYIYGTGAFWKGNVGKAVFIVDSTDIGGTRNVSIHFEKGMIEPTRLSEYLVKYEIRDFKPNPAAQLEVRRPARERRSFFNRSRH